MSDRPSWRPSGSSSEAQVEACGQQGGSLSPLTSPSPGRCPQGCPDPGSSGYIVLWPRVKMWPLAHKLRSIRTFKAAKAKRSLPEHSAPCGRANPRNRMKPALPPGPGPSAEPHQGPPSSLFPLPAPRAQSWGPLLWPGGAQKVGWEEAGQAGGLDSLGGQAQDVSASSLMPLACGHRQVTPRSPPARAEEGGSLAEHRLGSSVLRENPLRTWGAAQGWGPRGCGHGQP